MVKMLVLKFEWHKTCAEYVKFCDEKCLVVGGAAVGGRLNDHSFTACGQRLKNQ